MLCAQGLPRIGGASAAAEMPYDNQKKALQGRVTANPQPGFRTKQGPYVTPRLAGSPVAAFSTEAGRDKTGNSKVGGIGNSKDEVSTPLKAFISTNITPRSGSRKARVDSTSSTPNGTPTSSRPASMVAAKGLGSEENRGIGLGLWSNGSHARSPSTVSTGSKGAAALRDLSPDRLDQALTADPDASPMFFHASEAKSLPSRKGNLQPTPMKAATFFYANGEEDGFEDTPAKAISPREGPPPKFFHANGLPDDRIPPLRSRSTASLSEVSRSPKQSISSQARASHVRSTSPLKEFEAAKPLSVNTSPKPLRGTESAHKSKSPTIASPVRSDTSRRASLKSATASQSRHSKTRSSGSFGSQSEVHVHASPSKGAPFFVAESQSLVSEPEMLQDGSSESVQALPMSPKALSLTLPAHSSMTANPESKLEQMNTLAANARRERKVLDLEISNSSLLAINRTLEREMRKQTAELRRYRRLTSAGRISFAPSSRSASSQYSGLDSTEDGSDGSDRDEDFDLLSAEYENDDDGESSTTTTGEPLSPSAQAAHDARQRARDEQRLQLDLSKHQQLLLDSQRMNQSLKRCLGRTEDLIAAGRKALDYQVRVSDVPLGGRVLAADEVPGQLARSRALLSPAHEVMENPWEMGSIAEQPNTADVSGSLDHGAVAPLNDIAI